MTDLKQRIEEILKDIIEQNLLSLSDDYEGIETTSDKLLKLIEDNYIPKERIEEQGYVVLKGSQQVFDARKNIKFH